MKQPILSIIVTVYRVEIYLRECLDSIIFQSSDDWEVIIVDDGSDDSSGEICDQYAKLDYRIRVIHKENGGLTSARIAGVNIARGRYITFVDGDDWIDVDGYREIVNLLVGLEVDMICMGLKKEYKGFSTSIVPELKEGKYLKASFREMLKKFLEVEDWSRIPIVTSLSVNVVKRDIFLSVENAIRDKKILSGEDTIRVANMLFMAKEIYILHRTFYHYRIREGSMIRLESSNDLEKCTRVVREMINVLKTLGNYGATERLYVLRITFRLLAYMSCDNLLNGEGLRCFPKVKKDSFVVIYGKGKFAKGIADYIEKTTFCKMVTYIDREDLMRLKTIPYYNYILIGIVTYNDVEDAKRRLLEYGVPREKICCVDKNALTIDCLPSEMRECIDCIDLA